MTDATPNADDNCGCCRPPSQTSDNRVSALLARREAVDERLRRLESAHAITGAAR
jgi:hypothetical protein